MGALRRVNVTDSGGGEKLLEWGVDLVRSYLALAFVCRTGVAVEIHQD